jgi:hypothetical protein
MRRPDRIHFACPECNTPVRAPLEYAGKSAKCKGCGKKVRVPLRDEDAPAEPPTAVQPATPTHHEPETVEATGAVEASEMPRAPAAPAEPPAEALTVDYIAEEAIPVAEVEPEPLPDSEPLELGVEAIIADDPPREEEPPPRRGKKRKVSRDEGDEPRDEEDQPREDGEEPREDEERPRKPRKGRRAEPERRGRMLWPIVAGCGFFMLLGVGLVVWLVASDTIPLSGIGLGAKGPLALKDGVVHYTVDLPDPKLGEGEQLALVVLVSGSGRLVDEDIASSGGEGTFRMGGVSYPAFVFEARVVDRGSGQTLGTIYKVYDKDRKVILDKQVVRVDVESTDSQMTISAALAVFDANSRFVRFATPVSSIKGSGK